jgi:hypothetical protein
VVYTDGEALTTWAAPCLILRQFWPDSVSPLAANSACSKFGDFSAGPTLSHGEEQKHVNYLT